MALSRRFDGQISLITARVVHQVFCHESSVHHFLVTIGQGMPLRPMLTAPLTSETKQSCLEKLCCCCVWRLAR